MPPQPIRSVRRNVTVQLDYLALFRHPDLANYVAAIVALWSRIDSELGAILAYMLKGDVRSSVAMYSALTSSQAQMAALEAAAGVSLPPDDLKLFGVVIKLIKRAGAKRNKLAHWLWGESPEIADALLLVDPEAILQQHVHTKEFVQATEKGDFTRGKPRLDLSRVYVYRMQDFVDIFKELNDLLFITFRLSAMLVSATTHATNDALRNQLLSLPQIRAEL